MADFRFVPRYSISNIDLTVINASGVPVNVDAAPTVALKNYSTDATIWSRASTLITNHGVYRVTISSAESATPGLYYLLWSYNLATIAQQARFDVEIPTSSATLYNTLSDGYKAVVEYTWDRFEDLFDSQVGGPHLQMYAQSNFGRERLAQLMRIALNGLNSTSQPHSTYGIGTGQQEFPFTEWGGVLEQATTVEMIRHLMRSYVEQPDAQGISIARLDRRDYLQRWREIYEIENEELKRQLAIFKMAQMNLGRGSILVAGGMYGNIPSHHNPAMRPRSLPSWVR